MNDGAGGFLGGGPTVVPGIEVIGTYGTSGRGAGIQRSVNGNGSGTRKSTVRNQHAHLDLL